MSRHHDRLNRRRWAVVRRQVFDRDGWRCVLCGRPGRLECDHIRPLEHGGAPYALDNLRTVCRGCSIKRHRDEREAKLCPEARAWRRRLRALGS